MPMAVDNAEHNKMVILKSDLIRQMVRAAIMTEYNAKIQEIERRLSAAEAELRALKARDNKDDLPEPPHPRPKPDCCEMYYHIDSTGDVLGGSWDYITWDYKRLAIGNVFRTVDAAEYAEERLKVIAQMREWAGKWNDPYRILYIDGRVEPETVFVGRCISYGELRFASEKDAENCIKAVGEDRLKKYYFGISEDNGCCTSEI